MSSCKKKEKITGDNCPITTVTWHRSHEHVYLRQSQALPPHRKTISAWFHFRPKKHNTYTVNKLFRMQSNSTSVSFSYWCVSSVSHSVFIIHQTHFCLCPFPRGDGQSENQTNTFTWHRLFHNSDPLSRKNALTLPIASI